MMFEGLDEVPWHTLEHAHGRADDVPGAIRALLDPDLDRRGAALDELTTTVWHEGTVYTATAPAVPYLAEAALSRDVEPRTALHVALLLAWIADGGGEEAGAARDAVRRELPRLLRGPLPVLAAAALFPEERERVAPELSARLAVEDGGRRRLFLRWSLIAVGAEPAQAGDVEALPDLYGGAQWREDLRAALARGETPPVGYGSLLSDLAWHARER